VAQYDVVVIGSGPGGYVAAIHAAQQDLKVAIVEREPSKRLGGTCLLRGCIPTKAMLHSADLFVEVSHAEAFGVVVDKPKLDLSRVHTYKNRVVKKNAGGVGFLMKKNGIDVHWGHGRLAGKGRVEVEKTDGTSEVLETKKCVLATGSACRDLPHIAVDHERIINSDDILDLGVIPEHLVVIGAGAVGSEFASIFLRYGSKVTLVEAMDRVLPIEDEEVSDALEKSFRRQGMDVRTSTKLTDANHKGDGVDIVLESGDGSETVHCSHLLVAVGRRPVTEDCGLDKTSVSVDERGYVLVNEMMQTGEDWVYAIGDIVPTPWLAHVASKEALVATDHLSGREAHPIRYDHVPNCTYTSPEVASVGLTESAARAQDRDVRCGTFPFAAVGKAAILGQTDGFVKWVCDAEFGEILGLHIIGPKATELVAEGTLALELESTIDEILHTIHPHPTLVEALGEAAHAVTGHALHI
jgi:dihydrolipoamide dehydrogenase